MQLTEEQNINIEFYIANQINGFKNPKWIAALHGFATNICNEFGIQRTLDNMLQIVEIIRQTCDKLAKALPEASFVCLFNEEVWTQAIHKIKTAKKL